ncbi:SIS domain-containing protein [Natronosporangium hydrolyticum]|uniref:SIS domain-containing protein n=1 Tax=Natronosporangium hydrolyticum TaxID=2811111 RepID=A0A895YJF1_9ACTN|nr:SIS domain-containing protein [Natronosporangium hydrolyticum]QSB16125.1 SIS domain-containing protein [Natronosporangium hydrolyticum]
MTRERDDQQVETLFARRHGPVDDLAADAETITRACAAMADRFRGGGTLFVFGNGTAATDAQHVAVEFVHPVIVGKPALPAISLTADIATLTEVANRDGFAEIFTHQLRRLAGPADIALGISVDGECENVRRGLNAARRLGLVTVALVGGTGGPIALDPAIDHVLLARSTDPRVVKEVQVTTYHLVWELVQLFLARTVATSEVVDERAA